MTSLLRHREHKRTQTNLSAYIDGRLTSAEVARLERHLQRCPACRQELAQLRWTRDLVRSVPRVSAPRSFALPASAQLVQARQQKFNTAFGVVRGMALVASFALVVGLAADAAFAGGFIPLPQASSSAAPAAARGLNASADMESITEESLSEGIEKLAVTNTEDAVVSGMYGATGTTDAGFDEPPPDAEMESAIVEKGFVPPSEDPTMPAPADTPVRSQGGGFGMGGGGVAASAVSPTPDPSCPADGTLSGAEQESLAVGEGTMAEETPSPTEPAATATALPTRVEPTPYPTLAPTHLPTAEPTLLAEIQPQEPNDALADASPAAQEKAARLWNIWGWLRTLWIVAAALILILGAALIWLAPRRRI